MNQRPANHQSRWWTDRAQRIFGFILLTLISGVTQASNDKVFLNCVSSEGVELGLDIQLTDDRQGSATLVFEDRRRSGAAVVNDYFYHLSFASNNETPRAAISINRYTGRFTWESGSAPFGESNAQNRLIRGSCEAAFRKF